MVAGAAAAGVVVVVVDVGGDGEQSVGSEAVTKRCLRRCESMKG